MSVNESERNEQSV